MLDWLGSDIAFVQPSHSKKSVWLKWVQPVKFAHATAHAAADVATIWKSRVPLGADSIGHARSVASIWNVVGVAIAASQTAKARRNAAISRARIVH